MITKWYIGTLLLIVTLLGLNQEHTKLANQQIVLQFTDVEMTSVADHDAALAMVTKKLAAFGIANIEIVQNDDAQLSIRYYSDIDARRVRAFLSQESELDQLPVDLPEDQLPESCNIIVSDIQNQADGGLELNGKLAFEIRQDLQRVSNQVAIKFIDLINLGQDAYVQVALKVNNDSALAIENTSRTIPEVRAGPYNIC